jgi:tryptophan synthase beta chain
MKHETQRQIRQFGGFYVPEVLIPASKTSRPAFRPIPKRSGLRRRTGRVVPHLRRPPDAAVPRQALQRSTWASRSTVKREDLLHGGAHKVNNALGQGLLAKYMGKKKLIAETGAGQHGLATAMIGALFGMETKIFMGSVDVARQNVNVHKMKLCGAEVIPVSGGTCTLKDAINDALRYWTAHVDDTFYLFGTAGGPHPFPMIVRHFQSPIGTEARAQCLDTDRPAARYRHRLCRRRLQRHRHLLRLPRRCGRQTHRRRRRRQGPRHHEHCATLVVGSVGVLHGARPTSCRTKTARSTKPNASPPAWTIPASAPNTRTSKTPAGPQYTAADDAGAGRLRPVYPYRRHPAGAGKLARPGLAGLAERQTAPETIAVVNLSGRGDKDVSIVETTTMRGITVKGGLRPPKSNFEIRNKIEISNDVKAPYEITATQSSLFAIWILNI